MQSVIRSAVLASLKNDEKFVDEEATTDDNSGKTSLSTTPEKKDINKDKGIDELKKDVSKDATDTEGSNGKKRKRAAKADANWKALQKQITPQTKKRRRPNSNFSKLNTKQHETETETGKERSVIISTGNDEKDKDKKFSAFMKRAIRQDAELTNVVALDCEMVGVGPDGKQDALARVSVVNYFGDVLYDTFVKAGEAVTDYRTQWSGVREEDIGPDSDAVDIYDAQRVVGELLKGRIVVGHAIKNDFRVLRIAHPWQKVRDTSAYFKKRWRYRGNRKPALRNVVAQVLGVDAFQKDEHDSCEDARAALSLYKKFSKEWEKSIHGGGGNKTK